MMGISYQSRAVDLVAGEQAAPDHLARNPQGLVPALEIDGLVLTQSLAIIDYLDETRGAGFLPHDPARRAQARALAQAIAMEIQPICNLRVVRQAIAASAGAITMEDWMRAFITPGLAAVEKMLPPGVGLYMCDDRVRLPDLCLVPQLYNARRWGADLSLCPRLVAIGDALEDIPAVAAAHPDRVRPA